MESQGTATAIAAQPSSNLGVDPEKYKYKAVIGAFLGYLFDAYDYMVLAMAIPFIIQDWHISLAKAGLLATSTLVGTGLGAYLWGPMADHFGRKKILIACISYFGVTTVLCGFAANWNQLMVMRFIAGIGLGGQWVLGAALVTEFFPPQQRARATTVVQMSWPIGTAVVVALTGWLVPTYGWRILFFLGSATLLCIPYIAIYVPESPAWLKSKDNARKGIQSKSNTVSVGSKWTDLFKGPNLKTICLTLGICSCILISYWGTNLWVPAFLKTERGLSVSAWTWFLLAQQGIGLLSYTMFGFIGDYLGRRANLIIGGLASAIMVIAYMQVRTMTGVFVMGLGWALFCHGFWGPLPATIAEQFPTAVRGAAISISYATGRIAAAVAPFAVGGIAKKYNLEVAISVLAVFYLFIAIFGYFLKETKRTVVVD